MGSPMVRRSKSVDWAGAGTEGAPTCEDAMRSEFWDECIIIALLNLIYLRVLATLGIAQYGCSRTGQLPMVGLLSCAGSRYSLRW